MYDFKLRKTNLKVTQVFRVCCIWFEIDPNLKKYSNPNSLFSSPRVGSKIYTSSLSISVSPFSAVENVRWVLPDSYMDANTKDYGGTVLNTKF